MDIKLFTKKTTAAVVAMFVAFVALSQTARAQTREAYVVEDGSTLTFYYDTNKATRTGTIYDIDQKRTDNSKIPAWAGSLDNKNDRITKSVFDSSFKDYKPTDTRYWFSCCTKLENIEDIENLNTDQVTKMARMFYHCYSLTALDLSSFNTANVNDMSYMFYNCYYLKALDLSSFNTTNLSSMASMFEGCQYLTSLDLSSFNTENVTDISYMFYTCYALTTLDVSNFNTKNVVGMDAMFEYCVALTTIYCNDDWNTGSVSYSKRIFNGCYELKGAVAYDSSKIDITMANPETGYFTKKSTFEIKNTGTAGGTISCSITSADNHEVDIFHVVPDVNGSLIIPAKANLGAFDYQISSVRESSLKQNNKIESIYFEDGGPRIIESTGFRRNQNVNSIRFGEGLEEIGDAAFSYLASLTKIYDLPSTLKKIGAQAFDYDQKITEVHCNATTPPEMTDDAFTNTTYENATLYVPDDAIEAYAAAEGWRNFKTVLGGVGATTIADAPISDVYTIQGVRLGADITNLAPGIYIVRRGSKVEKIIKQ